MHGIGAAGKEEIFPCFPVDRYGTCISHGSFIHSGYYAIQVSWALTEHGNDSDRRLDTLICIWYGVPKIQPRYRLYACEQVKYKTMRRGLVRNQLVFSRLPRLP